MMLLFLLAMLMTYACGTEDLTGQMFTFPQQSNSAYVKLLTDKGDFGAVTLCHRTFTDLRREHSLFSMSTTSNENAYLVFWDHPNSKMSVFVKDVKVEFGFVDYKPNTWHSICTTWDSVSGLVQLWFNGNPSIKKFGVSGTKITGSTISILGQEQDRHGGGYDAKQSFVGMISDVHMWNYILSQCEIQNYMNGGIITQGNVFNWENLDFEVYDGLSMVVKERKPSHCTKMLLLLLLMMLMACASGIQDLSGKSFSFPKQTNTAYVKLMTDKSEFTALTLCHRSFTDIRRDHALFSMSTSTFANDYLIFWDNQNSEMEIHVREKKAEFLLPEYKPNMWHSICTTWDSSTGLVQMWFNGRPFTKKYTTKTAISGSPITILGQEQDSHGGGFNAQQCFIGLITDVHMWDHVISECDFQQYLNEQSFHPGNIFSWKALEFQTTGTVMLEDKYKVCV
ncbi:uncharacterized protein LOC117513484 [Thalassophryne amazonica]|uniref:uncharacterized protein LOC117513484 n=1 Tax=Thalassophryne amazonica TaxID=390379 RepID=UPI001471861D|nr:uncharacterized protein LOC117513484 [Thalassophryne amazonica]